MLMINVLLLLHYLSIDFLFLLLFLFHNRHNLLNFSFCEILRPFLFLFFILIVIGIAEWSPSASLSDVYNFSNKMLRHSNFIDFYIRCVFYLINLAIFQSRSNRYITYLSSIKLLWLLKNLSEASIKSLLIIKCVWGNSALTLFTEWNDFLSLTLRHMAFLLLFLLLA
jgi:hypothetical protein